MGPPNNQLRATSQEREAEIIKQLAKAGILFLVECAYNIAGLLASRAEYILYQEAPFARIKPLIESICKDNVRKLPDKAKRLDKTGTELVYDKVENTIY